jgi:hypothetical protein
MREDRMQSIYRILLLSFFSVIALPASATFHLWAMSELYSNADGSVQFLEMRAITGAQEFVAGHTLRSTSGGVTHRFNVPSNLEADSSGRSMLFGTQGFANLGVVTPDFIVPNGFFFPGGGSIDWGEGSVEWNHGALPTNGTDSLSFSGATGTNSPRNFLGQTGTVRPVAQAVVNIEGLWWASPANSESGWGVNLTQQGDIAFATWFTYDTDGSGLWLVASNASRQAGTNTYSGALFRTTGPAFSSATFDPSKVVVTQVGTATFSFTDANNGTFAYTVNGISQSKAITRQLYASPVPTCAAGGTAGTSPNFQDLWWRSPANSESGWGVNITHQGDILFVTWFTYDVDGKGMWLVGSNVSRTTGNTFSGSLFRTTGPAFNAVPWNGAQVVVAQVGTVTLTFSDADNGTFAYTVNGVSQAKPITRQVYSSPTTVCR